MRAAETKFGDELIILHVDEQETVDAARRFARQYNLESVFLMDDAGEIGQLYQMPGTPATYFIDADGIVQDFQAGFIQLSWIERNFGRKS